MDTEKTISKILNERKKFDIVEYEEKLKELFDFFKDINVYMTLYNHTRAGRGGYEGGDVDTHIRVYTYKFKISDPTRKDSKYLKPGIISNSVDSDIFEFIIQTYIKDIYKVKKGSAVYNDFDFHMDITNSPLRLEIGIRQNKVHDFLKEFERIMIDIFKVNVILFDEPTIV